MSHYTVMVKVSAARLKGRALKDVLDEMLEPYNEQPEGDSPHLEFKEDVERDVDERATKLALPCRRGYWRNPNAKWDWWEIGGRWLGFFPLKEGRKPRIGRPGVFDNKPEQGGGDVVCLDDIDMDRCAQQALEKAGEFFEQYKRAVQDVIEHDKIAPRSKKKDEKSWGGWNGPRDYAMTLGLCRVIQGPATAGEGEHAIPWSTFSPLTDDRKNWTDIVTLIDRATFMAKYVNCFNPLTTYAVLDESGWHAPGRMGWFGCSSDTPDSYVAFNDAFMDKFIKTSKPDDTLVLLDCHI